MKILIFILLPLISYSQDKWIEYDSLPKPIKLKTDPLKFKNALQIQDTLYLVQSRAKNDTTYKKNGDIRKIKTNDRISIDITFKRSGEVLEVSKPYKTGLSEIGLSCGIGMVTFFALMLSGQLK
jgi:hypothetical protein